MLIQSSVLNCVDGRDGENKPLPFATVNTGEKKVNDIGRVNAVDVPASKLGFCYYICHRSSCANLTSCS